MTIPLIASFGEAIFKLLLGGTAIFLILLVLVQRGRGGGLAGALGGMGGSSAFGAKAGDVFTRITIVAATIWILLCIVAAKMGPSSQSRINTNVAAPASSPAEIAPAMEAAPGTEQSEGDSTATASEDSTVSETVSSEEVPASEEATTEEPANP